VLEIRDGKGEGKRKGTEMTGRRERGENGKGGRECREESQEQGNRKKGKGSGDEMEGS